jgi:hypothetical protein
MSASNPQESDLVLGGFCPPPVNAAILGGLAGVKQRLASESIAQRLEFLTNALKYGDSAINLALQSLIDPADEVKQFARKLLRTQLGDNGKKALLDREPLSYFTTLRNWRQEIYNPNIGIIDADDSAYLVRITYKHRGEFDFSIFQSLLKDINIVNLKALIVSVDCYSYCIDTIAFEMILTILRENKHLLSNLKELSIVEAGGYTPQKGSKSSCLNVSDFRPLLVDTLIDIESIYISGCFLYLEFLYQGLNHKNLKTIVLETQKMRDRDIKHILLSMNTPNLEYFKLCLGGDSVDVDALTPLLSGENAPDLKYLGICHALNTDEVLESILNSNILANLAVLDLSEGQMTDKVIDRLANNPDLQKLKILNVSGNRFSSPAIELLQQMQCTIQAESQQYGMEKSRYWYPS